MPIFEAAALRRVIFIHIPKTGGTTLEGWLEQVYDRMLLYSKYAPDCMKVPPQHFGIDCLRELEILREEDYRFAVVRHPYDRIESEYFYRTSLGHVENERLWRPDFSSWVVKELRKAAFDLFYAENHFRAQAEFVDDSVKVFKFETGIPGIVRQVSEAIEVDMPPSVEKKKASAREPLVWSNGALSAVNKHFRADFERFGYEMATSVDRLAYLKYRAARVVWTMSSRLASRRAP